MKLKIAKKNAKMQMQKRIQNKSNPMCNSSFVKEHIFRLRINHDRIDMKFCQTMLLHFPLRSGFRKYTYIKYYKRV